MYSWFLRKTIALSTCCIFPNDKKGATLLRQSTRSKSLSVKANTVLTDYFKPRHKFDSLAFGPCRPKPVAAPRSDRCAGRGHAGRSRSRRRAPQQAERRCAAAREPVSALARNTRVVYRVGWSQFFAVPALRSAELPHRHPH